MQGRILIVEDVDDICDLLKEELEFEGYAADVVKTGDEAIRRILEGDYDLVFVDIKLGIGSSGVDVMKWLKEIPNRPKIVVISGASKGTLQKVFNEAGISEIVEKILEKPDDLLPDKLMKCVKRIFEKLGRNENHGE